MLVLCPWRKKNIDFGGGLERILAAVNDQQDVFETDLFLPIIRQLEELSGKKYESRVGVSVETQDFASLPANYQLQATEFSVLRLLNQFDEVVQHAASDYAPHHICTYLFELAQGYNSFYNSLQILNADKEHEKHFRLALTTATSLILKKGLWLLGIETVEQM